MKSQWQPTATLPTLQARAKLNRLIRDFFMERNVLEVETPLLSHSTATDPYLQSWETQSGDQTLYLQTSPEFGMKRLLAHGCGPIYQLGKAFRLEPATKQHNPEFTMLEWYRPDWTLKQLMLETEDLIQTIVNAFEQTLPPFTHLTYEDAFLQFTNINPHSCDRKSLLNCANKHINGDFNELDRDGLLDLLMSHIIEPQLPLGGVIVSAFPASKAALAQCTLSQSGYPVAQRAEIYIQGMELANGYQELTDPEEQCQRFKADQQYRSKNGLPATPFPAHMMAALESGLPKSAGIALGVDRLLMLVVKHKDIQSVLSFPADRA